MPLCFLDTNIITDWIIINEELQKIEGTEKRIGYLKNFKNIREEALYSYLLIETIKTNDSILDLNFVTSNLAMAEMITVTYERYIAEDLFKMLLPMRYLSLIKRKYNNEHVLKLHTENIRRFFKSFIKTQKIKLVEKVDTEKIMTTITKCKIDTYDSFLICQAIENSCVYFISNDERIKTKKKPDIKIVKSIYFFNKIRGKVEKPVIDFKLL